MTIKAKPILFNDAMIRALLNGTKTQTRRIMKPQLPGFVTEVLCYPSNKKDWWPPHPQTGEPWLKYERICPYGRSGDLLWVREAFQPLLEDGCDFRSSDWETGHGYALGYVATDGVVDYLDQNDNITSRCKPSIHMPRWASRLTLRITDVRVQRLQEISEADARAEGGPPSHPSIDRVSKDLGFTDFPRSWFAQLWDSINGDGAWNANPFVWAISFDVIRANVDTVLREQSA